MSTSGLEFRSPESYAAGGVPPLALAAAVLGFVTVLPVLLVSTLLWALTDTYDPLAAGWAVVPLPVAAALVVGGVRLLLRRSWVLLGVATLPVIGVGICWASVLQPATPLGLLLSPATLGLVVLPVLAASFTLTPGVRQWVGSRPARTPSSSPAGGQPGVGWRA